MDVIEYTCDEMDINIYQRFLPENDRDRLFKKIIENPRHIKNPLKGKKRNKTIYGSVKEYNYFYRGKKVTTKIIPWEEFRPLQKLAKRIEKVTGQPYNTCVIQIYGSGSVGIKPHRDKEMKPGSIIASISLGETRRMKFERNGFDSLDVELESGDLCLINPPTNNYWAHSIPTDTTKDVRVSLVYRNF